MKSFSGVAIHPFHEKRRDQSFRSFLENCEHEIFHFAENGMGKFFESIPGFDFYVDGDHAPFKMKI